MGIFREIVQILVVGFVIMGLLPYGFDPNFLALVCIYAILALSLGFIWGFGGILCFGQAAFFGLGAYAFAIAALNFGSAWGPLAIGIIVPAAFAFVLGALLFYGRLSDVYLAVVTLVITLILYKFMNSTAGEIYVIGTARLGGYNGIPGYETLTLPWNPDEYIYEERLYYFAFCFLLVLYGALRFLLRSAFGRALIGVRENELRAELMGYDIRWIKTLTFTLGAAMAGLAGALYANWAEIVTPNLFSLRQSADIIIWVIVGGAGTLAGPIVGAAVLGVLKIFLGEQSLVDNTLIMGVILILAILLMPRGLIPALTGVVTRLRGTRRLRATSRSPRARRQSQPAERRRES
jgi:ABC-type branched-subunit amino acid transport system permease subunit